MRELEGRSYAEIAEILDLSTSAVETLIFRARRALREQLEGSLTCGEAEFAISRQLDGRLPRHERGQLRAHLRECAECASFARRQRAQRGALKTLALVPLPSSLGSFFGGGAAVGTGLAVKAAAAVTAGLVIGGASYEGVRHIQKGKPEASPPAPPLVASVSPDSVVPATREHMPPVLLSRSSAQGKGRGKPAAPGQAKQSKQPKGHAYGRGNQKTRYAGDASVAARHVKVAHPTHPSHAVTRGSSHRRAKPKKHQLPGPFDAKPPRPHNP
jgi:anti-sigma factor RsiW